jgi:hypothetical protein
LPRESTISRPYTSDNSDIFTPIFSRLFKLSRILIKGSSRLYQAEFVGPADNGVVGRNLFRQAGDRSINSSDLFLATLLP